MKVPQGYCDYGSVKLIYKQGNKYQSGQGTEVSPFRTTAMLSSKSGQMGQIGSQRRRKRFQVE